MPDCNWVINPGWVIGTDCLFVFVPSGFGCNLGVGGGVREGIGVVLVGASGDDTMYAAGTECELEVTGCALSKGVELECT